MPQLVHIKKVKSKMKMVQIKKYKSLTIFSLPPKAYRICQFHISINGFLVGINMILFLCTIEIRMPYHEK